MREKWKDIEGYSSKYQISNNGRVKSFKRKDSLILGNTINNCGYKMVMLYINGKPKNCSIHRLVAYAFIKNKLNKRYVNHKDGNKLNNKSKNLEYVTMQENINHAYKKGLFNKSKGEQHYKTNLVLKDIKSIRKLGKKGKMRQEDIGKIFGISKAQTNKIINNKSWVLNKKYIK
jgi:hypothetical protein